MNKTKLTSRQILQPNIQHCIIQRSTHQELEREIIHPLGIGQSLTLLSSIPLRDEAVAEGQRSRSVRGRLVAVEHAAGQRRLDVAHDLALEFFGRAEGLGGELLPCFPLGLGDRCWGGDG